MNDYLTRLRAIEKNSNGPGGPLPKPPKPSYVSSVSTSPRPSQKFTTDDSALRHLWRLTADYRANLIEAGLDPAQAKVELGVWREACRLDPFTFHEVLVRLTANGRVHHMHHHVWLA